MILYYIQHHTPRSAHTLSLLRTGIRTTCLSTFAHTLDIVILLYIINMNKRSDQPQHTEARGGNVAVQNVHGALSIFIFVWFYLYVYCFTMYLIVRYILIDLAVLTVLNCVFLRVSLRDLCVLILFYCCCTTKFHLT